jgi:hypothetical protein
VEAVPARVVQVVDRRHLRWWNRRETTSVRSLPSTIGRRELARLLDELDAAREVVKMARLAPRSKALGAALARYDLVTGTESLP